ncbi:hypothetical protein [Streptomyces sp. CB02460]|uniref:hypothetical protein n=1 Tax=Streptomyces sp. CB02460 TaxID=1703941 RepID=UPI00095D1740|nr:hypothetical protein [Streptomyces sp. CB02460]OKJ72201.1 hypothetical protein AMK30_20725 [Streptomyces sp. CB02460]
MLQPAFVVPEKRGGFLIHSAQLVVWEVRNTSLPGEGTQVYVIEKMSQYRTFTKLQVRQHFHPHPSARSLLERQTSVSSFVISLFRVGLGDSVGE